MLVARQSYEQFHAVALLHATHTYMIEYAHTCRAARRVLVLLLRPLYMCPHTIIYICVSAQALTLRVSHATIYVFVSSYYCIHVSAR